MVKAQEGINTEAIVIWRKKHKNYSIFTLMTKKEGLIACAIPHRRLINLKGAGYLQAFNAIQATLKPAPEDNFSLDQVDGIYAIQGMTDDFNTIAYAAVAGELIMTILPKYQVDLTSYRLISLFSQRIRHKSIRLATIILGWQLLMLGGFIPSGRALKDPHEDSQVFWQELAMDLGRPLSKQFRDILIQILSYAWKEDSVLNLTRQDWQTLEKTLYAYAGSRLEKDLQSINFLQIF